MLLERPVVLWQWINGLISVILMVVQVCFLLRKFFSGCCWAKLAAAAAAAAAAAVAADAV